MPSAYAGMTDKIDFHMQMKMAEEVGVEPKGTFNALHRF